MFTFNLIIFQILYFYVSADFPFNDVSLSWKERVDDLVKRLTVDEITLQMALGGRSTYSPGIPRLGIKPYPWGAECLRGDVEAGPATSFPQALGLAATFSKEVVYNVSLATGLEVRAKFNNYSAHGDYGPHTSASCWSPVINILRDPRWGRNQETYGEDPFMSGQLAIAYVKGLQGNHPRYIRANAGCKHFDVHGGPENIPVMRFSFDANVTETDWRMTFLPAFKACIAAGTYSVMCSYNRINGIPACANKKLLTDILRNEWGFEGYVISDEGAIENIMLWHKYTNSSIDTAAACVNAGTNLEDGSSDTKPMFLEISEAVTKGKLKESFVREAVKPLFYTRMRLGLFDPPEMNPYAQLNASLIVQQETHRKLTLEAAMRSFVLLKNMKNFLPLKSGYQFDKLAIVGPLNDNVEALFGGYAPDPDPSYITTPRVGLSSLGKQVLHADGCKDGDTSCSDYNADSIKQAVTGADLVIVNLGTGCRIECEGRDRKDINFPGYQFQLLQDAVQWSSPAPVILLMYNAGPFDISWALNNDRIVVIMECFFPAQSAGEALLKVFYNDGSAANPAGRLPNTWPVSVHQYPPITDYTMKGRTYRYFEGDPLFPFGYGLSYSQFTYRYLNVRPQIVTFTNNVIVDVYVVNNGPFDGEEVVQVYITWPSTKLPAPKIQLVAFGRYFIAKNEGISCQFHVSLEQLAVWDDNSKSYTTVTGTYAIYAGGQQPFQKTALSSNVLQSSFTVA